MGILVTNDDGILAEGLWTLAGELRKIAPVMVVAPDREQSAIGTAVTLHHPLRVHRVKPAVPDIETYAVEGTPSDCVILALNKLAKNEIDLVVAGINQGANLGDDVLISGTVAAALQGYLRGLNALAISAEAVQSNHLDTTASLAALLVQWINTNAPPDNVLLNVNVPERPPSQIQSVEITRLASATHIDTAEEGSDGKRKYYWLVRHKTGRPTNSQTDVWVVAQGNISITPLHTDLLNRPAPAIPPELCSELLKGLRPASKGRQANAGD